MVGATCKDYDVCMTCLAKLSEGEPSGEVHSTFLTKTNHDQTHPFYSITRTQFMYVVVDVNEGSFFFHLMSFCCRYTHEKTTDVVIDSKTAVVPTDSKSTPLKSLILVAKCKTIQENVKNLKDSIKDSSSSADIIHSVKTSMEMLEEILKSLKQ